MKTCAVVLKRSYYSEFYPFFVADDIGKATIALEELGFVKIENEEYLFKIEINKTVKFARIIVVEFYNK